MLIKNLLAHKGISISLSLIYSTVLVVLCLIPLEELPKVDVKESDKIFHLLSYIVFTLLWFNTFSKLFELSFQKLILLTIVFSILFGIIIEVLQGSLTTYRASDYHDVIANSLGVLTAVILISWNYKRQVKKL